MKMTKKLYLALAMLLVLSSLLAACGGETPTAAPAGATDTPAAAGAEPTNTTAAAEQTTETTAAEAPTAATGGGSTGKKFTIGISNPFISSEYRTQMIQELKDVNKEYMDKGITNDLVIESADTDVAGQLQQLQNLMSKNVNAILVNPGDVSGLNATLQEAVKKGI